MIQRRTRDYEVSLWSLQDSLIAILKQYGLEYKGQIEDGKLADKIDGTQTFSFKIPMYYIKDGQKILNPSWYNVTNGSLLVNMRKIKVIFNKDDLDINNRKIYEFLIVRVTEEHTDNNELYCNVECEGLAFHELGKIGYKISLTPEDFYNDDYDWATNGKWYDTKTNQYIETQPLATLNYWNDKVFSHINNWSYLINMNWDSHSLERKEISGVLEDYVVENDTIILMEKRESNKVYEEDFIDSWKLNEQADQLEPSHMTYAREKARVSINILDSNIYNITQSLAETFGIFCKYEYTHDENCHIIGRKVIYYNNFLQLLNNLIDIIYPYQTSSVTREIDSTDLVTKLYVKSIEDASGILNIMDVGANKSQEDYILNFDYLYNIGAITEEQYQSIDKYILDVRKLNEKIARMSSKVISLQSQLAKIEAEHTTRKNAIALDTEQLLANTALLNAITNGELVISISSHNPQTAVLLKDTAEARTNSYYVKITQKGVYPESIHLFKKYSYNNSILDDEITTGVVVFDLAGEVIRVNNIYIDESDPKTVYLTYKYRPKLYYERIVAMWQDRLNDDTVQAEKMRQEIARLNYSLYGKDSKYSMQGINLKNLTEYNIYNQYMNLLEEKNNLIKDFNSTMGPAIRLGYWQPEDYNDYGDKYNDRFEIQLSELEPIAGTTGNCYFKWDDELFLGLQDLYYEYSAAQYKQAYPCIDLSTKEGTKILRMLSLHPDLPISFVYTPVKAIELDTNSSDLPIVRRYNDQSIILIPDLYLWNAQTDYGIKFSSTYNKLPQELKDYINNESDAEHDNRRFTGLLQYQILQGWRYGDTTFSWQSSTDGSNWANIVRLNYNDSIPKKHDILYFNDSPIKNNCKLLTNNNTSEEQISAYLQLLSTSNTTLNNQQFRLVVANNRYGENSIKPITSIRFPGENTILVPLNIDLLQHKLKTNNSTYFLAKYKVINSQNDYDLNYYTWIITNVPGQENNTITISYRESLEQTQVFSYNLGNNRTITCRINVDDNNVHKLLIINSGLGFLLMNNNPLTVSLNIKTPIDYAYNQDGINSGLIYTFYKADTAAPYIVINESILASRLDVIYNGTNDDLHTKFVLALKAKMLNNLDNTNLESEWQIKNNNTWVALLNYLANQEDVTIIQSSLTANTNSNLNESILYLQINNKFEAADKLKDRLIRGRIKNIVGWSDWYEFDSLTLSIPITDVSWDNNLTKDAIILSDNAQLACFVINAKNATSCTWSIVYPDLNIEPIQKKINAGEQNITISGYNNRYKFNCLMNGDKLTSTLLILIPTKDSQNNLQDNKIQLFCTFENNSNAASEEPTDWKELKINYEISIDNTTLYYDWWPIQNKVLEIILLKVIIPDEALVESAKNGKLLFSNNLSIVLLINQIYLKNNSLNYYNFTLNDQNKFIFSIDNLSYDANNECYSCKCYLSCLDLDIFKINSTSIIDTNSLDLDQDYKILGTAEIAVPSSSSISNNEIKLEHNFLITIRQCKPIITNVPNNFLKTFTNNKLEPTLAPADMYTYTGYQYPINNIEIPKHPIHIKYNSDTDSLFNVNLNSIIGETVWACRSDYSVTSSNERVTTRYYHWLPPITNEIIIDTLWSQISTTSNGNNVITDAVVTKIGLLNSKGNYSGMGYNENLYVKITNPWGTITSKAIKFD